MYKTVLRFSRVTFRFSKLSLFQEEEQEVVVPQTATAASASKMGKTLNIVWSLLTASMTLLTTSLMGYTIMSNHWEVITYDHSVVESMISSGLQSEAAVEADGGYNVTSVRPMMDGRVIVVTRENEQNELLVRMHAGLWATCYDLTGNR